MNEGPAELSEIPGVSFPFLLFGSSKLNDTTLLVLVTCVTGTLLMNDRFIDQIPDTQGFFSA